MGLNSPVRHGRKYGEAASYPIPLWNGLLEKKHFEKIGPALWVYEWLLDRITKEVDGVGVLLGGKPIKASEIASTYGMNERTARAHIDRLKKAGYIIVKHAPYGLIITVLNSMKFGIWKPSVRSDRNARPHNQRSEENSEDVGKTTARGRKESSDVIKTQQDAAIDAAEKTTAATHANPWNLLGTGVPMGSSKLQKLFQHYASTRNGNPLSEAMERTILEANNLGVRVPPPFFDAKREVERQERQNQAGLSITEIPELEAEPWAE